ncbi:MAG: hypothetical protein K2K56_06350 [Lachnospiraceae bacterium]|nr:hypothetical protein [Lachnospiraceae bacterium]
MVYKLRFGFAVLAMMLVSIVMYIIIHESGHALVAALCGANNVKISILSSITWYTGGSFTAITEALFNVAGIVLPVCVSWISMFFYSKRCKNLVYYMAYVCFYIITTASVLAWVFLPVYSMFAPSPENDDVTKFLNISGISPVIVSLTAVIVILFSIFIAVRKQLFNFFIQLAKDIGKGRMNSEVERFVSQKSMLGVVGSIVVTVFIIVLVELPGITAKPILSFAVEDEVPETVTYRTFDIQQENEYNFQTRLDSDGLLVVVNISNQAQETVFRNIIYDKFDSNSTFDLPPGTYTLSVAYLTDTDMFESYCSTSDLNFEDLKDLTSVYEQETQLSELFIELKQ